MKFRLHTHQEEFIVQIRSAIIQHRRVIACAATGMGKSKVFISIANFAHAKGKTVLIISESRKIYSQVQTELPALLIKAGSKDLRVQPKSIYLAMAQTLRRRNNLMESFVNLGNDLLVITDEVHVATSAKLLAQLNKAWHVGFTATPIGKHLAKLFDFCVVGPQPEWLVANGFLAPYRHFARVSADLDKLQVENGEFTEESQQVAFETDRVFDNLEEDLQKIPYKKCLIFCSSINHCTRVSDRLNISGFKNVMAHSLLMPEVEFENLQSFTSGEINICVSVGMLTKGFDFPAIDLPVLMRATNSLALYLQMIGRGSRLSPETEKTRFTVLDYGANWLRHGHWDAFRDWGTLWNLPSQSGKGVAPVKMCPICMYINHASAMHCKNCGFEFPRRAPVAEENSKLLQITANFAGKMLSQLDPEELAIYAKQKNKRNYAIRVAKSREQDESGYLRRFAKAMNYKPAWVWRELNSLPHDKIKFYDFILK